MGQPTSSNDFDWTVVGGSIVTLATIAAAVFAGFKAKTKKPEDGGDGAAETLEGVFQLVQGLRQELDRKLEAEKRCEERIAVLEQRIEALERIVAAR